MMRFKLIAFGFNAHGQLSPPQSAPDIPEDIHTPRAVASASHSLRVLFAGWSDTLRTLPLLFPPPDTTNKLTLRTVEIDGTLHLRGAITSGTEACLNSTCMGTIASAFGDHSGLKGVITIDGGVFLIKNYGTAQAQFNDRAEEGVSMRLVAIAGNGEVCAVQSPPSLLPFPLPPPTGLEKRKKITDNGCGR
jgi:hypothetical protein